MKHQTRRFAGILASACLAGGILASLPKGSLGGDWPQWRYDAGRGAASPDELPKALHLQWVRQLPKPRPAWPASQRGLRFDLSYSPVAAGKGLFVPSMVSDTVTAYDTETGAEQWRFYTDGPVRFAPIAEDGKVYFGSDDGYLYCVDGAKGRLLWRLRGGRSDRKVLGNQRLISTWPVRGGPVLHRGTIYFTAGIWPFMGIFVHAVDAETGKTVWTNSGAGSTYTVQPHNSPAFAGLAPRGHLAATDHGLIVPGGRTQPGCYDLATGTFRYFSFGGKGGGSYHVSARDKWFFTPSVMARIADGKSIRGVYPAVHDENALYGAYQDDFVVQDLQTEEKLTEKTDRKGRKVKSIEVHLKQLWKLPLGDVPRRLFLKAGSRFYSGGDGVVAAIEVNRDGRAAKVVWKGNIEGRPWAMLAADGKLFVVTVEGRIYCFGGRPGGPKTYADPTPPAASPQFAGAAPSDSNPSKKRAEAILKATSATEGYCLMLGLGTGRLAEALVRRSKLHLIAIDPDAKKIDAFRRRMDDAGLYGTRVVAHVGDPAGYPLPPYLASLIISEDVRAAGLNRGATFVSAVFGALRPYGGVACFPVNAMQLEAPLKQARLTGAELKPAGRNWALLVRDGALPGAADWTHNYADAAASVVSKDRRVRVPLGLLWFGGPPNDEVLPRHGHGPSPQVAAGRLFIEGGDLLRALDIYTGRLLWQKQLPELGRFYDVVGHQPGAGEIGSNYVSLPDSVYVVYGNAILKLDAASGEVKKQFKLEAGPDGSRPHWGYIAACDDLLVATSTPVSLAPLSTVNSGEDAAPAKLSAEPEPSIKEMLTPVRYSSASRRLVVINRHTGKRLWDREAKYGFRHNNIAVGAEKVFCIDGMSRAKQEALKRRGTQMVNYRPRLLALDLRTGEEVWGTGEDVFGTFLNYSAQYDVLLQAGSAYRDRAKDETDTGMVAFRGRDGKVIWKDLDRKHAGPCMLHHDTIITQGPAYSLPSGEPKVRKHPLTGEPMQWKFTRNYGCNTAVASEHLITFRSAAAGFYDLANDGGTGNFGGFKSGCTSNLIVAGGLLCAPEYTRTCECRYQNQTSLAMVHDPEVEIWTFNQFSWDGKPVRRVGINFGAPGDRLAADGTLWLDYPSRGGPSPDIPIQLETDQADYFRYHSSHVQTDPARVHFGKGRELNWVAASGVYGIRTVTLTLAKDQQQSRKYTVRLHFAELEDVKPGGRAFNISLQDKEVLRNFDVVQQAGGPNRAVVKQFSGVEAADELKLSLAPSGKEASLPPVLCGIEVIAEGW